MPGGNANSLGIFANTVHLSASKLPEWVTIRYTPADRKLTAGSSATTSIYIDTDAVIGYMSQAHPAQGTRNRISKAAATTLALILAPFTLRRRRRLAALFTLAIAAALLASASGCSSKYPDSTPPGTYTLQIIGTGTQTGLTHTINLPSPSRGSVSVQGESGSGHAVDRGEFVGLFVGSGHFESSGRIKRGLVQRRKSEGILLLALSNHQVREL